MKRLDAITEDDLHAYVDGLLSDDDRAAVEAWLTERPEERERVADWKKQAETLRNAFAAYAAEHPHDTSMFAPKTGSAWRLKPVLLRTAAVLLIFAAGAAAGRLVPSSPSTPQDVVLASQTTDIPAQAKSAYLIYASEVRHPVEVGAEQQPHLAAWLGKRLGYPFAIPDLSKLGYDLVGGRLIPVSGKPGAMLMYQDKTGRRVTVLIGRNEENRTTSFRMASADGVETFYWIDNELGYAVSAELTRDEVQKIAEECYRQFPA
ncbi:anti-sigma factor family protein [Agrobacterium arsenijevicii]|uniref:Membrane protein n=1 Tax=Agrobacterium arsenijevicii TaxID=1585697 RepID=A0ABR5DA52_9HYPH|nr:membrane protein [Agrobacterium arsenijevicii]